MNSKRIEFNAKGKGVHYSDFYKNIIDQTWELTGVYCAVFYDYFEPSLYDYLKAQGIGFRLESIDFKIRDGSI